MVPMHLYSAWALARATHKDQRDDGGHPYIEHVARVVNAVAFYEDMETTIIAMLHDTLEKHGSPDYIERAIQKTLTANVYEGVRRLTWERGQPYVDHIARVIEGGKYIIAIKLAEIRDNLDEQRLGKPVPWEWRDRQLVYQQASVQLANAYQLELGKESASVS